MRKLRNGHSGLLTFVSLAFLGGCTTVETTYEAQLEGPLPRPELILVHNFAGSASEVKIDSSVMGNLSGRMDETPLAEEQIQLGRQVADALAAKLVEEIQAMGMPAERAAGPVPEDRRVMMIEGQFLSISQGNRGERVVIGLGAGRSSVKLNAEMYGRTREGRRLLESFTVDAAGSMQPGMAETMGAGALAGNLAVSAAVSGAGQVGSEAFGQTVEADAKRGAAKLAERIGAFFVQQGWIPPTAVKPDLVP